MLKVVLFTDKDAIIAAVMALIEALTATNARLMARIVDLAATFDRPRKTPNDSSMSPSKGQRATDTYIFYRDH
jgi:hypothetical protein